MRKIGMILVVLFFFSTILAGCGSTNTSSDTNAANAETTNTEKQEANTNNEEKTSGKTGGKIVIGIPQDFDSLDPHKSAASGTSEVMFNLFEGLVIPTTSGEVEPALAEDWKISDDGFIYSFKIRQGLKFHNGSPVTPEDIKYSYDRLAIGVDGEEPLSGTYADTIEKIEVKEGNEVVFTLKTPNAAFLSMTTQAVIPKDYKEQETHPIGTGPFKFKEYKPGYGISMVKFEEYWNAEKPYLDEIEFKIFTDGQASLLALQSGEIDILPRIGTENIDTLDPNKFTVISAPQNMVQLMALNHKYKPLSDVRVRKALYYAVDIDEIIDVVSSGRGTKLGTNFSPVMSYFYKEGLESVYDQTPENIEKAKQLLKDAGYENGFDLTITVPSVYQFHVDTAQMIVEDLKEIGINANIELVEWATWLERVYTNREHQSTIIGFTGKLDPDAILGRYVSDYSRNFVNYNNPEYDKVIKEAKVTGDSAKRAELYKQAQEILNEDAVSIFIQDPLYNVAMNSKIKGYRTYPLYIQDLISVYWEK